MRVSIIMPTLNQASFIEASLESIFSQSIADLEVLVIDGMSTDGTLDILHKFQLQHPEQLKWLSAKDTGPAEAVNRGLKLASGEIIGWLNSDDLYEPNAIKQVLDFFKKNKSKSIVYGHGNHIDEHDQIIEQYPTQKPQTNIEAFKEGSFICQPTLFFRKNVIDRLGVLDASLKLAFDFDWWIRFFKSIPNEIGFIDKTLASSRLHSACLTKKQRKLVAYEGMKVLSKHFDHAPTVWAMTYIDEICNTYPFIEGQKSLVSNVESFLNEIKMFVAPEELKTLISNLSQDQRLKVSSQALYADISPDGWLNEEGRIKLRWEKDYPAKFLIITLNGGWPKSKELEIEIRTPFGGLYKTSMNSQQSLKIRLEIPYTNIDGFHEWHISCKDYFIPSEEDPNSDDHRRLSMMIKSLELTE